MKRKTQEEFCKQLKDATNNEYIMIGKYINTNTKILVKHNIPECGFEWETFPLSLLKGHGCPKCSGNLKYTNDTYCQKIIDLFQGNIILLSNYIDNKTNIKYKNINCGHEWEAKPFLILEAESDCPICHGNRKKTTDEFKSEVYNLVKNEYTVLGEYKNTSVKIEIIHNNCGNKYMVSPRDFLNGKRCPKCQHRSYKKTTEEFKQEVYKLVGNEYTVLSDYITGKDKVLIKHNNCGNEYMVTPSKFLSGDRCPICSIETRRQKQVKSHDQFIKEVYSLVGNEYTVIGKYINAKTKIKLKHNLCGSEYYVKPGNFLNNNRRCPICNESKGEQIIRHYLENNNYNFVPQYEFDNLIGLNGGLLKFDFAIFKDKEKTKLKELIEYDGEQHFRWISGMMAKENFIKLQKHDKMKNEYCKKYNIKLIRIPYTEFDNIENILNNKLNEIVRAS